MRDRGIEAPDFHPTAEQGKKRPPEPAQEGTDAIRDNSLREAADPSVKIAADRLANAIESMQDAFALFDRDERLVLCNTAYRQLTRRRLPAAAVGTPYETFRSAWLEDIAFDSEEDREQFRSGLTPEQFEVHLLDGRVLRVTDRPTPEGGIVETITDITRDVRLSEALRGAREAADAANSAKSEFLSSMSHELRTPLNSVLGFGQLLDYDKKEPLSARHRKWVLQIIKGGEHLLHLVDQILDLSRIEAGRETMSMAPVSVPELLHEVRTTLIPLAEPRAINVEIHSLSRGAETVKTDRTRFSQILMNFGSNAIKYNRHGGKVMFVVSLVTERSLRIAVRDTGIGIPLDKQHTLFKPFQRAGQEAGPIEGTGIGLAITKRLADLMGGDVGFHSVPGEGSEFWIEFPLDSSSEPIHCPPHALA